MSTEKTEQATPKKLQDARKDGSVTRSTDLTAAATLLAMLIVCYAGKQVLLDSLRQLVTIALDFASGERSMQALASACFHVLGVGALVCIPVSMAGMVGALIGTAGQVGLQLSFKPVMPKLDSISPGAGLKRIFSKRSLIDLGKMIVKAAILIAVVWKSILWLLPLVTRGLYEPVPQLSSMLWDTVMKMLSIAFLLYLIIGAADWKLQHWVFLRSQRMTKDEVKREHKNSDGDPKIKRERRKLARELLKGDPRPAAVARSNVVVVNPTHYAVALRYDPSEHPLPLVLAKGVDADAAMLRKLATRFDVPIVANPPVARALHRVEVNAPIPEEMFEVIAAILRWVESVGAARNSAPGASIPSDASSVEPV